MLKLVLSGDPILDDRAVSIIAVVEPPNDPSLDHTELKRAHNVDDDEDIFLALIDPTANPTLLQGASKEINLQPGQGSFVVFPYPNKLPSDRFSLYAAGPTNCGKSTTIAKTAEIWGLLKRNKKKDIFIFCRAGAGHDGLSHDEQHDPAFRFIKPKPIYVSLDPKTIFDLKMPDLKDSLVIFDDTDVVPDKKVRDHIMGIRSDILQNGRHHHIDVMNSSHLVLDFNRTKQSITESTVCVVFPTSGMQLQIERLLKAYLGLNKHQIAKIQQLPRWAAFLTISPRVCIHPSGAFCL